MVICAIVGCSNTSKRSREQRTAQVGYFRLPTIIKHQGEQVLDLSKRRQSLWLARIHRDDVGPEQYCNIRVCGLHFHSGWVHIHYSFESIIYIHAVCAFYTGKPSYLLDETNIDWAPSLQLGYDSTATAAAATSSYASSASDRYIRAVSRRRRRQFLQLADQEVAPGTQTPAVAAAEETEREDDDDSELQLHQLQTSAQTTGAGGTALVDIACLEQLFNLQNSVVDNLQEECSRLRQDNVALRGERDDLREKLARCTLTEKFFRGNDERVKYYTGLTNWNILSILMQFVEQYCSHHQRSALSPFQQVLLTLMRLRLGLSGQDLGYRFGIHRSTVSRVFAGITDVLYARLHHLIVWPDREVLRATLPMDFRKHCPQCAVIIDCFEIFIERPSALLARAQTYSQYKHHNTAKYLIGITPTGIVSYISKGWGGRVSDKHLTENCSILSNLLPGDTILADRGFDIKDSVGLFCATVKLPAFTKGKKTVERD